MNNHSPWSKRKVDHVTVLLCCINMMYVRYIPLYIFRALPGKEDNEACNEINHTREWGIYWQCHDNLIDKVHTI
jgi:hypothetical protein